MPIILLKIIPLNIQNGNSTVNHTNNYYELLLNKIQQDHYGPAVWEKTEFI